MQCWRVITLPLLNCWVCTILTVLDLRGFTARTWVRSADTLVVEATPLEADALRRELANYMLF